MPVLTLVQDACSFAMMTVDIDCRFSRLVRGWYPCLSASLSLDGIAAIVHDHNAFADLTRWFVAHLFGVSSFRLYKSIRVLRTLAPTGLTQS